MRKRRKRTRHVLRLKKSGLILILITRIIFIAIFINLKIYFMPIKEEAPTLEKDTAIKVQDKVAVKKEDTDAVIMGKFQKIKASNSDTVGYIYIKDTNISYPIMYTKGEDYYLHRDINKDYDTAGTPYIDKRNLLDPRDTNLLIYGHNMKNGTMFHDLMNYTDSNYYKDHSLVYIYDSNKKHTYKITNVFKSKIYNTDDNVFKFYKFYNAVNETEFNNYVSNIDKLSLYNTGETLSFGDRIITLVTCEYSVENGRMVVVAKEIE